LGAFNKDDNTNFIYSIWSQILSTLANVKSVFGDVPDVSEGLKKFTVKLIGQATKKIGWEFAPNEDHLKGMLRSVLISQAGGSGDSEVIAEAQRRFKAFVSSSDPSAIHPSLRLSIFRIAIRNGGKDEYEAVKKFYTTTTSVDGKEIALQSMGSVSTAELAKEFLDFSFSPAVAVQDKHSPAIALAANAGQRGVIWDYVKAHWEDAVFPQLEGNKVVLERWLKNALNKYSSYEIEKDIATFFEGKDCSGFDRGLSVVRDTIIGSAKYKERDLERTREWLKVNGYL
jgi:aminopeptidase N